MWRHFLHYLVIKKYVFAREQLPFFVLLHFQGRHLLVINISLPFQYSTLTCFRAIGSKRSHQSWDTKKISITRSRRNLFLQFPLSEAALLGANVKSLKESLVCDNLLQQRLKEIFSLRKTFHRSFLDMVMLCPCEHQVSGSKNKIAWGFYEVKF